MLCMEILVMGYVCKQAENSLRFYRLNYIIFHIRLVNSNILLFYQLSLYSMIFRLHSASSTKWLLQDGN